MPVHKNLADNDIKTHLLLDTAFIQAPFPILILKGMELRIIYANDFLLHLWHEDQRIIGKDFLSAFPQFKDHTLYQGLLQVMKGASYSVLAVPFTHPGTGAPVYLDFTLSPVTDSSGQVTGILMMGKDVTSQAPSGTDKAAVSGTTGIGRLNGQMREHSMLRVLIDNSSDGIFSTDPAGNQQLECSRREDVRLPLPGGDR